MKYRAHRKPNDGTRLISAMAILWHASHVVGGDVAKPRSTATFQIWADFTVCKYAATWHVCTQRISLHERSLTTLALLALRFGATAPTHWRAHDLAIVPRHDVEEAIFMKVALCASVPCAHAQPSDAKPLIRQRQIQCHTWHASGGDVSRAACEEGETAHGHRRA